MASTGNVFPTVGANDASIGATAWVNPGNVVSDNTTDATCGAAASSQYLVAKTFGFAIPAGAVILGVTVQIEASESSPGSETLNARLQDAAGALVGAGKTVTVNGANKSVYIYGSVSDDWSASLTPAIVNDPDFGVRFWYTTSHNMAVDYVTLAVEYADAITGTLSVSETGSDTFAAAGSVLVEGTLAATESGSDTFAAVGNLIVTGTLAATETGSDTFTASGTVSGSAAITGTLAATETGSDTFTASGGVIVTGTLAAAETGSDTFAAAGAVLVEGALAATEIGSDTFAAVGGVLVSGTLAASETGSDTFAAAGDVLVSGTLAAVESGSDTFAAVGGVLVEGVLAASETGSDTFAASGTLGASITGTLAASETGSDTFAASGTVQDSIVTGTLDATEVGSDTFAASGTLQHNPVTGTMSAQEEGSDTFTAVGRLLVSGVMNAQETGSDTWSSDAPAVESDNAVLVSIYRGNRMKVFSQRHTAPAALAVSVAEFKEFVRQYSDHEDNRIEDILWAAIGEAEDYTQQSMEKQSRIAYVDGQPDSSLELDMGPVVSITSVKYRDPGTGALTTVAGADYELVTGVLTPVNYGSWPSVGQQNVGGFRVIYVAGWADHTVSPAVALPPALHTGICLLAQATYAARPDCREAGRIMLDPYRKGRGV